MLPETVRPWGLTSGQAFANAVRRPLQRWGDTWHLDEVVTPIAGRKHWLWRAVDQHGVMPDVLVRGRRGTAAAKRFVRKLLKGQGWAPRVMVTDRLGSHGAARRATMPGVEHRQHKGLNDRAENSRQPTRLPERVHQAVQVAAAGATLPLRPRPGRHPLPPPRSSLQRRPSPPVQASRTQADVTGVGRAA